MNSVHNLAAHHVLTEVGLDELLVGVPVESAARLINLLAVVDDPWLSHILRKHFSDSLVQLREVEGIVLFESALGLRFLFFDLRFLLVDAVLQELIGLV